MTLTRRGWWTGEWWNELTTQIDLNLLQVWADLDPDLRAVLVARSRSLDTMGAWERYLDTHKG